MAASNVPDYTPSPLSSRAPAQTYASRMRERRLRHLGRLPQLDVVVDTGRGERVRERVRHHHIDHIAIALEELLQLACIPSASPCPRRLSVLFRLNGLGAVGRKPRTGQLVPHEKVAAVAAADHMLVVWAQKVDALDRLPVLVACLDP